MPDTTGPVVSIVTPSAGQVLPSHPLLQATATDVSGVATVEFVFTAGATVIHAAATFDGTYWVATVDLSAVAAGAATVAVTAADTLANVTTTPTVAVVVPALATIGPPDPNLVPVADVPVPDPTDPYGVDLFLDPASGDLVVGGHGGLVFSQGPENCAQALQLRARTYPGELPLHPDYGSQLAAKLIGQHASDDLLALGVATREVRTILDADRRFKSASDLRTFEDPNMPTRRVVTLTLELAGGEALLVGDLADARIDELNLTNDSSVDPFAGDTLTDDPIDDFSVDLGADDLGEDPLVDLLDT